MNKDVVPVLSAAGVSRERVRFHVHSMPSGSGGSAKDVLKRHMGIFRQVLEDETESGDPALFFSVGMESTYNCPWVEDHTSWVRCTKLCTASFRVGQEAAADEQDDEEERGRFHCGAEKGRMIEPIGGI